MTSSLAPSPSAPRGKAGGSSACSTWSTSRGRTATCRRGWAASTQPKACRSAPATTPARASPPALAGAGSNSPSATAPTSRSPPLSGSKEDSHREDAKSAKRVKGDLNHEGHGERREGQNPFSRIFACFAVRIPSLTFFALFAASRLRGELFHLGGLSLT